jgi:nucleoid DNA-binding protein
MYNHCFYFYKIILLYSLKFYEGGFFWKIISMVTKTLKKGDKVTLVGFGTFSVSKRAARNGRNPQTGAVIKIKAKKVAKFKAGKELSAKI